MSSIGRRLTGCKFVKDWFPHRSYAVKSQLDQYLGISAHCRCTFPMRTSEAHPLRIDEVCVPGIMGRIGITFCPGKKGESLTGPNWDRSMEADLQRVSLWGATHVVTLIEDFEFEMLQVPELGNAVASRSMCWHHLPIVDGQPPDQRFLDAWPASVTSLVNALKSGQRILVHCRGGLGRAGTVASILLAELGVPPRDAIEQVRLARPGAIETDDQERFIEAYKTWAR